MSEEPVDETHLVDDKKPESQADDSRNESQAAIETSKAILGKCKWNGNRRGDQHHPRNGANAENEQIQHRPGWNTDGGENQQRNGGRSGKTVNNPHGQGPQDLIETKPAKGAI